MGVGRHYSLALVCACGVFVAFAWAYSSTFASLWRVWSTESDYSHGFFVVPLALYFAWFRRSMRPPLRVQFSWAATALLALSVAMRVLGQRWNFAAFDYWSLLPWASALVLSLGGAAALRWWWPSIFFLLFMMPLPYRAEHALSMPLQTVATGLSCWIFQVLGHCALAEGHTILLGDQRLEIEQACSGLRMVFSAAAMGVAYAVLSHRRWWERLLLVACTFPIAVLANAARIVSTGLAREFWPGSWLADLSHDGGGYLMIVFAFVLFLTAHWYLNALIYPPASDEFEALPA